MSISMAMINYNCNHLLRSIAIDIAIDIAIAIAIDIAILGI